MGVRDHDSRQWRLIATIEPHASLADALGLPVRAPLDVDLERVAGAPPSSRWFDVSIGDGDECYAHCACAVLRTLNRSAHARGITALRRVDDSQRLTRRRCGVVEEIEH
jgi:hypothetical protein